MTRRRALSGLAAWLWIGAALAATPPPSGGERSELSATPSSEASSEPAEGASTSWRSPEKVSRRNTAYTLPAGRWALDAGALGVGEGDVYATLGAAYGLGAGFEIDANLAHSSVGLLNVTSRWHFLDTRYVDLGVSLGFVYGNGAWFWVGTDFTRALIADLDIISVPLAVTASFPVANWIAFDLHTQYTHAEIFGSVGGEGRVFYFDSGFGVRQAFVRPGAHISISDSTEIEAFATLPFFSSIPLEDGSVSVPFSETWGTEAGLRSQFMKGVFGSVRLHYGALVDPLYGSPFYPSFDVEYRP